MVGVLSSGLSVVSVKLRLNILHLSKSPFSSKGADMFCQAVKDILPNSEGYEKNKLMILGNVIELDYKCREKFSNVIYLDNFKFGKFQFYIFRKHSKNVPKKFTETHEPTFLGRLWEAPNGI